MSLMGSLYVGASGLRTGQNALNTIAHNMANTDTVGYTRQQISLTTSIYNTLSKSASAVSYQQVGLGVTYAQTKQIRDYFLDKTYRKESGRSAFYEVSSAAIDEIQDLLQEMDGETFSTSISNLWNSVQDMANEPNLSVNQNTFVQRCNEFLTAAQAVYTGLSDYQDNLNVQIKNKVDSINSLGEKIRDLNEEILKIESNNVEQANDLRDQRNKALDDLSQLVDISYSYDTDDNVLVKIEGTDFVTSGTVNEIAMEQDETTGFYTPYWAHLATRTVAADGTVNIDTSHAQVFDMSKTISTDMNTDIGGLKSALLARGDRRATYADLADANVYDTEISQSIIMNTQAEFDQLINKVCSAINQVLEDSANSAGTYPDSTYLRDSDGNPYQIFEVSSGTNLTTMNINLSAELKQSPTLLGFVLKDGSVDYDTMSNLKEIFNAQEYTLNPNVETKTNFVNYYNNLVSQIANTGSVMKTIAENQQVTADGIGAAREQVLGVSTDEELSYMIQYQNAYNASSRYINVVSEMLEHILSTLGR